jgi:protein ImuA
MSTPQPSTAPKADAVGHLLSRYAHTLWRANQVGHSNHSTVRTGFAQLDRELPGKGWPVSCLIEFLVRQAGIGEIQLLAPALRQLSQRATFIVQPPHVPTGLAWQNLQLPIQQLYWIKTSKTADALWSAEQILKSGTCGALLLWQSHIRPESLRRLHLAAQETETAFWLMRPIGQSQDASPAPLRLALRPSLAGLSIDIVKRRGPRAERLLQIPLAGTTAWVPYGDLDRDTSVTTPARSRSSSLA